RDRTCTHPTCEVSAERCQVDHIVPWAAGGPTTQENGRLLCGYHNRLRNQRPPPSG
ncbi:MAG: HNH endonuclease signature motif containing protein, partial [Acidimicrobiales bacterium]